MSRLKFFLLPLLLSILLALSLAFSSCIQKPTEETSEEWGGKEDIETPKADEALLARYEEYKENVTLAFKENKPQNTDSFEFEEVDGGMKIVSYSGADNIVVLPEKYGEKSVVSVAKSAFADNKTVRALYVPDSVKEIEDGAFSGMSSLSTLRVPFVGNGKDKTNFGALFGSNDYVTHPTSISSALDIVIVGEADKITDNAFAGCKGISAIVFEKSVKEIGRFAFYECADLVYVSYGEQTEIVGNYAFGACPSLYSIDFHNASVGFGAVFGASSLFELSLSFSEDNNYIGHIFGAESADYNDEFVPTSLNRINFVGETVPQRAFASCAYIKEINLFDVSVIEKRAFYGCRSLENVVLPDSVALIDDDAFFGCDGMKSITFGKGVKTIGMQAFYGCKSLKEVVIPTGVTEIKPSTFALCTSLESVTLNNVKSIGRDAFWRCACSPSLGEEK